MARNSTHIDAPPADVWRVLEDAYAYPQWVVGTDRTVDVDREWPAPGSAFRVHVVFGHVDSTTVKAIVPGARIVLDAASSYLGPARVTIDIEAEGDGTRLTLIEDPAGKVAALRLVPPVHLAIRLRNVESLRRLRQLVQSRREAAVVPGSAPG